MSSSHRTCTNIFVLVVILLSVHLSDSISETKFCRAREKVLPKSLFVLEVSAKCYEYTADFRKKEGFRFPIRNFKIKNGTYVYVVAGILVNKETVFLDYKSPKSQEYMRKSFTTDYFYELWYDCSENAVSCCENRMNNKNIVPDDAFPCPAVWDGWSCFDPAKSGTTEYRDCPRYLYSADTTICVLKNSQKECFSNGTWNDMTDYADCSLIPTLVPRHNFHIYALIVSAVLSTPSVVIFFAFRKFRATLRIVLHRNLILCLVCRNIITMATSRYIFLDALYPDSNHVMETNGAGCKALGVIYSMFNNATYAFMFVDGFYLHKSIVRPFAKEPKAIWLYCIVAFFTFVPLISWIIARAVHEGQFCWMLDYSGDHWINDGFRMAILVLNVILLLDIIRAVLMKLRHSGSSNSSRPTMAALKATLFLIPLFGIYILIIMNPKIVPDDTCKSEDIYNYACYVIESLQAIMVAFLFCYFNKEVHDALRNALRKTIIDLEQKYGLTFGKNQEEMRRATTATYVGRPSVFDNTKINNNINNNNHQNQGASSQNKF